jgi:hypothetical protein
LCLHDSKIWPPGKSLINKLEKPHKSLKVMKIRYTRDPFACFQENSPELKTASFAGHLESKPTRGWKNGLYITLSNNDDSHQIMF